MAQPLNFFFAIKQYNQGKIDSHHYFFRGFCSYLRPEFVALVDIGTEPQDGAISKLYEYLDENPGTGGVCGEIEVDTTSFGLCNKTMQYFLIGAQFIEYKLSHYLDKAFEACFGFVAVLPGAFSAFRLRAIEGGPLDEFFRGMDTTKDSFNCF